MASLGSRSTFRTNNGVNGFRDGYWGFAMNVVQFSQFSFRFQLLLMAGWRMTIGCVCLKIMSNSTLWEICTVSSDTKASWSIISGYTISSNTNSDLNFEGKSCCKLDRM